MWSLSSSLSGLRDSPERRFLQRGSSFVLNVGNSATKIVIDIKVSTCFLVSLFLDQ